MALETLNKVAMLAIGDELLRGDISDLNTPYLARWLVKRGAILERVVIVPDDREQIAEELLNLKKRYATIFTSGGLGPTHDDVTIEAISAALKRQVVLSPEIKAQMEHFYEGALKPAKLRMARIPEGSNLLFGAFRWVPVIMVDGLYILPGVPEIFAKCIDFLSSHFIGAPLAGEALYLLVGESLIADTLTAIQERHPEVVIGSYPFMEDPPRLKLNVVHPEAQKVAEVMAELKAAFAAYLIP